MLPIGKCAQCADRVGFAGLVARPHLDMAQRMLDDPGRRVIDVALELGYSDPAHFTRAFVRWTGVGSRQIPPASAAAAFRRPGMRTTSGGYGGRGPGVGGICSPTGLPNASGKATGFRRATTLRDWYRGDSR